MSATEYGIIVKDRKFYCDGNPFDTFSEAMEYRRSRELTEKRVEPHAASPRRQPE